MAMMVLRDSTMAVSEQSRLLRGSRACFEGLWMLQDSRAAGHLTSSKQQQPWETGCIGVGVECVSGRCCPSGLQHCRAQAASRQRMLSERRPHQELGRD